MLSVLFKLIVMQPEVLLTHVKNYADLAVEELQHAFAAWRMRVLLYAVSAVLLGLGVLCGLMSLLLWGALPALNTDNAWVLVALPLVLLAAGCLVGIVAKRQAMSPLFAGIQEQIDLDMLAICQAKAK
ncbi:hypothetical protein [Limnohabitans sp.]|uniref:hypothetical protein n=1 Tax=Limnohabitans sp. TaxID=1907725 RepID=UPI00286FA637|nr:hypothetical protein [Limnohabitans sp.]